MPGGRLAGINIDSAETGSQNWTADFAAQFEKRRGFDLRRFLPAMAGARGRERRTIRPLPDRYPPHLRGPDRRLLLRRVPAALPRQRHDLDGPNRHRDPPADRGRSSQRTQRHPGVRILDEPDRRHARLQGDVLRRPRLRQADRRGRGIHRQPRRRHSGQVQTARRQRVGARRQPLRRPCLHSSASRSLVAGDAEVRAIAGERAMARWSGDARRPLS